VDRGVRCVGGAHRGVRRPRRALRASSRVCLVPADPSPTSVHRPPTSALCPLRPVADRHARHEDRRTACLGAMASTRRLVDDYEAAGRRRPRPGCVQRLADGCGLSGDEYRCWVSGGRRAGSTSVPFWPSRRWARGGRRAVGGGRLVLAEVDGLAADQPCGDSSGEEPRAGQADDRRRGDDVRLLGPRFARGRMFARPPPRLVNPFRSYLRPAPYSHQPFVAPGMPRCITQPGRNRRLATGFPPFSVRPSRSLDARNDGPTRFVGGRLIWERISAAGAPAAKRGSVSFKCLNGGSHYDGTEIENADARGDARYGRHRSKFS
jgi:hypothetical protein